MKCYLMNATREGSCLKVATFTVAKKDLLVLLANPFYSPFPIIEIH